MVPCQNLYLSHYHMHKTCDFVHADSGMVGRDNVDRRLDLIEARKPSQVVMGVRDRASACCQTHSELDSNIEQEN